MVLIGARVRYDLILDSNDPTFFCFYTMDAESLVCLPVKKWFDWIDFMDQLVVDEPKRCDQCGKGAKEGVEDAQKYKCRSDSDSSVDSSEDSDDSSKRRTVKKSCNLCKERIESTCSLCSKKLRKGGLVRRVKKCGHRFHEKCILKHFVRQGRTAACPNCSFKFGRAEEARELAELLAMALS